MGKGNRNSQQRLEDQVAIEEKNLAQQKARKSKKNSDRWIAVACIVLAVLVVSILVLNVLKETGVFMRATDAITIADDKDIYVNAAMMKYFINDYKSTWYNNYYIYVMYGMLSVDMSSDLRTQVINSTDASYLGDPSIQAGKTTWYDYFKNGALETVEMYLTYAYCGKDIPECALTEEDYKEIDETIAELKASLKDSGMTIAEMYGTGITEKDIRDCSELIKRASKFSEYKQAAIKAELEADKTFVNAYPGEHKADFYSAKYLSYKITVSAKTEGSIPKYDKAVQAAKAAIEQIKTATTPAEFVSKIEAYEETKTEATTATTTETATEKELTEEELIDKYTSTITWETGDELGKWVFAEDRNVNDVTSIEKETTEATTTSTTEAESGALLNEKYEITAYMLLEKADVDHTPTHNIAYLIADDKAAAEGFLAEFLANSTKSRDEFVRIADAHYDVLHASHDHAHDHANGESEPVFSFAKVDMAKEDYFNDSYAAINSWINDAARVDGDYTAKLIEVSVSNSDGTSKTYYAAVYFEKHSAEAWYSDALAGATQQKMDEWYKAELAKGLININSEVIDDIL